MVPAGSQLAEACSSRWPDAGPDEAWGEAEGRLGLVGILFLDLLSEEEGGAFFLCPPPALPAV